VSPGRCIVVDADVARAAGHSPSDESLRCNRFLAAVIDSPHSVAFSIGLREEWTNHAGSVAIRWLAEMTSRRRVRSVEPVQMEGADVCVRRVLCAAQAEAALKDLHLLRLALAADKRIASKDAAARRLWSKLCNDLTIVKGVIWVNPVARPDGFSGWLADGARGVETLRLRSNTPAPEASGP
jgi:hypothetical protein